MNSVRSIFQEFCFLFFPYFLGTPFSRNIPYLVAASETIVSNILTIKNTKKIFSFSKKHVARNREYLSEKLNANAELKRIKSQDYCKNISEKKSIDIYLFSCFLFFIYLYMYLFIFYFQPKKIVGEKVQLPKKSPLFKFILH